MSNQSNFDSTYDSAFNEGVKNTIPDVFFVFLPLIVIFIVSAFKNDPLGVFNQAEWSFAAAVLSGQSIVKMVFAVSASEAKKKSHNIAIAIAAIIVLLLVPSLIVLVYMLIADPRPSSLPIIQIVLFILSLVVYILFGGTSESMIKIGKSTD